MEKSMRILQISFCLFLFNFSLNAQLLEKAGELLNSSSNREKQVAVVIDSLALNDKRRDDSLKIVELELQIQEMKLREIMMNNEHEMDKARKTTEDSIRLVRQREQIDSLRKITPGYPVLVEEDTLFVVYARNGGLTPFERATNISEKIQKIGKDYALKTDSVFVVGAESFFDVMYGDKVVLSVTREDGLWMNTEAEVLAREYATVISEKIAALKKEYSILNVAKRVSLFILVLVAQFFLLKLTNRLFRSLKKKIAILSEAKLKPIRIKDYEFLDTHKQGRILLFSAKILRYLVVLLQLAITIPIMFYIFPQTKGLAETVFSYLMAPIKMVFMAVITYIPKLFIIAVIVFAVKAVLKGIEYVAKEIEGNRLKITGFYPDWAMPTYNIVRFILYAFMVAMIYPYLPGAGDGVFDGISVLIGLMVSLGASTAIGNIISGLIITYMRPFKIGDRIKLNETKGNVIEKTPFVTRIRTLKNEIVTIPNSFIMSSHTTNYSESARQYGLIVHLTVSFGYSVSWRKAHEVLINAALRTEGVEESPTPYILETKLDDFYTCYQVNACIKDANLLGSIYARLYRNIMDTCQSEGIELLSPHYYSTPDGEEPQMPPEYLKKQQKPSEEKA